MPKKNEPLWKRVLVKFTSVKTLVTFWACFLISFLAIRNLSEYNNVALALTAVPIGYFAANSFQHKIDISKNEKKDE